MAIGKPKYTIGQRLVYMDPNREFTQPLDDNMVVESNGEWYDYENHPNGGYWQYEIEGKANSCPEDHLLPYVEGQKHYCKGLKKISYICTQDMPEYVYKKWAKQETHSNGHAIEWEVMDPLDISDFGSAYPEIDEFLISIGLNIGDKIIIHSTW